MILKGDKPEGGSLVWSDAQVIEEDTFLVEGGEAEDARRAMFMRVSDFHFDGPGIRFGAAFFPGFGAHHPAAISRSVHSGLERVPFIGTHLEGGFLFEAFQIRADLQLASIAAEADKITLVDEADV